MKSNKKYYFTVEGETERWYLLWLQGQINNEASSTHTVTLNCPIEKNPLKRAKSLILTGVKNKTVITHIFDRESEEEVHTKQFYDTLDAMKKSERLGKQIKYQLGYSNFTFELWMVLHKVDCNRSFTRRSQYLQSINRAYIENFPNLDQYKQETNFHRVLSKLTLADVKDAITRSKCIMQRNAQAGYTLHEYKGYKYYKENPSLSIWESIEKILADCHLL
ncbi:RloB family protein [Desulfosporosinus nitroreducens]|uniref:RloB family protein n=1 Tax=Desulfosporosinus nitroreducens TaxID=2018668 RepID=UPI00207C4CB5|nr:RloB family protein [Desulfosporosinus nitroreducens]MCO1601466.1 RloB family protein [Desulfosporosinus nitroreducens]